MSLTLPEIKTKLAQLNEVTLLELLQITSDELVDRFSDVIEDNAEYLEEELEDESDDE